MGSEVRFLERFVSQRIGDVFFQISVEIHRGYFQALKQRAVFRTHRWMWLERKRWRKK